MDKENVLNFRAFPEKNKLVLPMLKMFHSWFLICFTMIIIWIFQKFSTLLTNPSSPPPWEFSFLLVHFPLEILNFFSQFFGYTPLDFYRFSTPLSTSFSRTSIDILNRRLWILSGKANFHCCFLFHLLSWKKLINRNIRFFKKNILLKISTTTLHLQYLTLFYNVLQQLQEVYKHQPVLITGNFEMTKVRIFKHQKKYIKLF